MYVESTSAKHYLENLPERHQKGLGFISEWTSIGVQKVLALQMDQKYSMLCATGQLYA